MKNEQGKTLRILLVEDNPGDARFIREFLKEDIHTKYLVQTASRLSEAHTLLSAQVFHVILLDLNLPDSKGLETIESLRTSFPDLPIVVLTGNDQLQFGEEAIQAGAQDYFSKGEINDARLFYTLRYSIERQQYLQRLREKRMKIVEMNKELKSLVASREKLVSIIAHDLRGGFNPLLGLTDLLMQQSDSMAPEELMRICKTINRSLRNQFNLLENLLSWGLLQSGKISMQTVTLPLGPLVEDILSFLQVSLDHKELVIRKEIDAELTVRADERMLRTVLRNILSNAVKFSYRQGIIIINAETTGDRTRLEVKDNGPGIAAEILSTLFASDKYTTTPGTENEQGSGLGLSLCHDFIVKMDGTIKAESSEGGGTTLLVELPR